MSTSSPSASTNISGLLRAYAYRFHDCGRSGGQDAQRPIRSGPTSDCNGLHTRDQIDYGICTPQSLMKYCREFCRSLKPLTAPGAVSASTKALLSSTTCKVAKPSEFVYSAPTSCPRF